MNITKNKIAIISHSLGLGGAERFAGTLSFILNELDYEVHVIIINDKVDYEYCGQLYNLGEKYNDKSSFLIKKVAKSYLLNKYLKDNKIQIIIDNRSRNSIIRELIYKWIYSKAKVYYMIHSYNLDLSFPKGILANKFIYKKATKIICVAKAIENKITEKYKFKNTITQYNPIDFSKLTINEYTINKKKYILFFGRLEEKSKNFSLMIEAFSVSKIYEKGYKLLILGNGPDLNLIEKIIKKYKLEEYIEIIPFQNNPFNYVKNAKFTILTSRYEGFPMSIIESLALGTPIVSVDCNSGPAEVIINEYNGLLVKNYDVFILADAIKRFVDDKRLYDICKSNTLKSVNHLSVDNISKQWKKILE
ncbi:glycosyltransferase [Flavobacterium sp.]|uniref:glycosyltransferase n=1 Tax=Flavobacterium sp. TaxID=239 RepID=UPI0037508E17